jgi:hypothetical protein
MIFRRSPLLSVLEITNSNRENLQVTVLLPSSELSKKKFVEAERMTHRSEFHGRSFHLAGERGAFPHHLLRSQWPPPPRSYSPAAQPHSRLRPGTFVNHPTPFLPFTQSVNPKPAAAVMATSASGLPAGDPEKRERVPRSQLPQPRTPPPHRGRWREGVGRGLVRPGQTTTGALCTPDYSRARLGAAFPPWQAAISAGVTVASVGS